MRKLCFRAVIGAITVAAFAIGASAKAERSPSADAADVARSDGPEAKLKKGMAAGEVRAVMGPPREVRSMEAPDGKAEVWIYRDLLHETSRNVQVGAKPIMVTTANSDGRAVTQKVGEDPIYKIERKTTYRVVSLLMFNDRYVMCKVAEQVERSFE